jgi:hypothetical protein
MLKLRAVRSESLTQTKLKSTRGTQQPRGASLQKSIDSHAEFADYFWDNDYMGIDIDRVREIARSETNEHRQSGAYRVH